MIGLPEAATTDPNAMADYARLVAYEFGELDRATLENQLADSSVFTSRLADYQFEDVEEVAEDLDGPAPLREYIDNVWTILQRDSVELGEGHPFTLTPDTMTLSSVARKRSVAYMALLIREFGLNYAATQDKLINDRAFRILFEKIVEASLGAKFRGPTHRFGFPYDSDKTGKIKKRVRKLELALRLKATSYRTLRPNDKDRTLDVACRYPLWGTHVGGIVLLAQCATGKTDSSKKGEPDLDLWSFMDWDGALVRVVAIPETLHAESVVAERSRYYKNAVIMDRHRICSVDLDRELTKGTRLRLAEWVDSYVALLPAE